MAREADSVYTKDSILDFFEKASIGDGRKKRGIRHSCAEVLIVVLLGFLMGFTSIRGTANYFHPHDSDEKKKRQADLNSIISIPHGPPSRWTISRTIAEMDPVPLVIGFANMMYDLVPHSPDEPDHIAIDGKAIRAALNKTVAGHNLYIVNVFNASYHLFLYQTQVGPKSAEATVIANEIVDILEGTYATVTMDAMGTKTAILDLIYGMGDDAVLPIKRNNRKLMEAVADFVSTHTLAEDDRVDHFVDLGDFSDEDDPSMCIENTVCSLFEEDNRSIPAPQEDSNDTVDGSEENTHEEEHQSENDRHSEANGTDDSPLDFSQFRFFSNVYPSFPLDKTPTLNAGNKGLAFVKVGNCFLRMIASHGRLERREYDLITDPDLIRQLKEHPALAPWPQIQSVGLVTRYRAEKGEKGIWKISITRTPYLLTNTPEIQEFAETVKGHWACEVSHHILDLTMEEDRCTSRKDNAAQNLSLLRKLAINLAVILKQNTEYEPSSFKEIFNSFRGEVRRLGHLLSHRIRSPFK